MKNINLLNNERGGILLITLVTISICIVALMSIATLKLAEAARHTSRVHESFKYLNVMESMGQTIGKARMLGVAVDDPSTSVTCAQLASGTTSITVGGKTLCIPAAAVTGICIDWDSNAATTNDVYCLESLSVITKNEDIDDSPFMVAENKGFWQRTWDSLAEMVSVGVAYAACTTHSWNTPCTGPTAGTETGGTTSTIESLAIPSAFTVEPTGTAAQKTNGSGTGPARANLEPWTPDNYSWAHVNEVYTPTCTAANQYWLGCMSCNTAINPTVTCIQMTMCPPSNPSCAAAQRYKQTIAIY